MRLALRIFAAVGLLVLQFSLVSPVSAGAYFQPYEGRNSVRTGDGGTRITKHGIDYWTTGTPPKRYQILGVILDKRRGNRISGTPLGSPAIAKVALAAGGNAVIFMGVQAQISGTDGKSQIAFDAGPHDSEETQLLCVKYLPDEAVPATPSTPPAAP
jgi:hypothetical protein